MTYGTPPDSPVLGYIASVDTASSVSGTMMFSCGINATITPTMFQYQYLETSQNIIDESILSGFIYPSSVSQIVSGQDTMHTYLLPIPISSELDRTKEYTILVRVFHVTETASYSDWSNQLPIFLPPPKPQFTAQLDTSAFYKQGSGATVSIWLTNEQCACGPDVDECPSYIVSYYYTNTASNTVWETTGIVESTVLQMEGSSLVFTTKNHVKADTTIYLAVNEIIKFTHLGNDYYSLSEISDTLSCSEESFRAPVLDSAVYGNNAVDQQTVELTWSAPGSAFLQGYHVDNYTVQMKHGDDNWISISPTVDPKGQTNTYSYPIADLSNDVITYIFRVIANSTGIASSLASNELSITTSSISECTDLILNYVIFDQTVSPPSNRLNNVELSWAGPSHVLVPSFQNMAYDIYLTVDNVRSNIGSVSTPTYTYVVPDAYKTSLTNLTFDVVGVLASGRSTDSSAQVSTLTFTYPIKPSSIYVNYSLPTADQLVDGHYISCGPMADNLPVEVMFTFNNSIKGLGSDLTYRWFIMSDNDVIVAESATDADFGSSDTHSVTITYTPLSGSFYKVHVVPMTTDSNGDRREGNTAESGTIQPTLIPTFGVVTSTENTVDFEVKSNIELAPYSLVLSHKDDGSLHFDHFDSRNYLTQTIIDGEYNYTFSVSVSATYTPSAIIVSNSTGIALREIRNCVLE